jgi:hypothetical protein
MGLSFRVSGYDGRIGVWFSNPLDGGSPYPAIGDEAQDRRWTRSGSTFDDLSITPSIDAYEAEVDGDGKSTGRRVRTIWHGHVTNGEVG